MINLLSRDVPTPLAVPKEIWNRIFSFVDDKPHYKQIVRLARTCLAFYQFFFHQHPLYGGARLVSKLAKEPKSVLKEERIFNGFEHRPVQAHLVSGEGRHYFLYGSENESTLCILESCNKTQSFLLHKINLFEELKEKFPHIQFLDDALKVRFCHIIPGGFLVVSAGGVTQWKYVQGKPFFHNFYTPKNQEEIYIEASVLQNGLLYLEYCDPARAWGQIDFNCDQPEFKRLAGNRFGSFTLLLNLDHSSKFVLLSHESIGRDHTFNKSIQLTEFTNFNQMIEVGKQDSYIKAALFKYPSSTVNSHGTSKWLIAESNAYLKVFNLEENKLWFETKRQGPNVEKYETVILSQDFLIHPGMTTDLKKNPYSLSVIHLPSKKMLTGDLLPFFRPYLDRGLSLFYFELFSDTPQGSIVTAIFREFDGERQIFHEIKFYLDQKNLLSPDSSVVVSQNRVLNPKPEQKELSIKILLVVSGILFLLTVAVFLTIRYLTPSSGGFPFRGTAVSWQELLALSIGSSSALIVLAISCHKLRKKFFHIGRFP